MKMPTPITVTGLGERKYDASEYTEIPILFKGVDQAGLPAITIIRREFHIVNELTAKALIRIDVPKPERAIIDLDTDSMIFRACEHIKVSV